MPTDSGGGFPQNTYSTVERIDYNITDKTTLYGRYALYSENEFAGTVNNSPYIGYDTGQTNFNQNVTINLTHVFTPSFVSSTKLIYNRLNNLQPLGHGACQVRRFIPPALRFRPCRAPTARWSTRDTTNSVPATPSRSAVPRTCIRSMRT